MATLPVNGSDSCSLDENACPFHVTNRDVVLDFQEMDDDSRNSTFSHTIDYKKYLENGKNKELNEDLCSPLLSENSYHDATNNKVETYKDIVALPRVKSHSNEQILDKTTRHSSECLSSPVKKCKNEVLREDTMQYNRNEEVQKNDHFFIEYSEATGLNPHITPSGSCLKASNKSPCSIHVQFETPPYHDDDFSFQDTAVSSQGNNNTTPELNVNYIFSSFKKNHRKTQDQPSGSSTLSIGSKSSTNTNESKVTEFERQALDGGWGWVIVFASFIVHCIADGVTMSFGILYIEFLEHFGESKSVTSWVGSSFAAVPLLAGPLASYATDSYGCRAVTIWGSIMACLGFLLSAYANSIIILFFTIGLVAGLGLAVCYVAAIVIVAFYFEKYRSLATGIAVAGSGIGTFIFAPIIQYFLENYGWRGTMILLAGIFLNMAVCGSLMRDLEWKKRKPNKSSMHNISISSEQASLVHSSDTFNDGIEGPSSTIPSLDELKRLVKSGDVESVFSPDDESSVNLLRSGSLLLLPTYLNKPEVFPNDFLPFLSLKGNAFEYFSSMYPHLLSCNSLTRSVSEADVAPPRDFLSKNKPIALPRTEEPLFIENQNPGIHRSTIPLIAKISEMNNSTAVNSCHKLEKKGNCISHNNSSSKLSRKFSASWTDAPKNTPSTSTFVSRRHRKQSMSYRGAIIDIYRYRLRSSSCPNISRSIRTTKSAVENKEDLREIIISSCEDMSYCMEPSYVIFAISNFILYVFYDTVYMYLTDYALEIGFPLEEGANLISSIGIFNCVGMIIMGYMGDKSWSSPMLIYNASMVACGLSVIVMPFIVNYWLLVIASASFGLFISANYALTAVILVELISLEAFSKSYGMLLLIQGIANLIGPPLVGFMADATGSYVLPFVLSGVCIAICGLMLALIPFVEKYKSQTQSAIVDLSPKNSLRKSLKKQEANLQNGTEHV